MKIFIIVLIILLILYLITTYIMFVLVSKKSGSISLPMTKNVEKALEPYKDMREQGTKWIENKIKNKEVKDVYIKSNDNLKLHGIFIENKKNKGIIIETHGYRSVASRDLYPSCFNYYNMGYSLLIIDFRTSNLSEGKYITFGIKESEEVISWVKYLNKKYKSNIYLAGISMGATAILMSLKDLKEKMNVKAVVVDCGYISPYDEVLYCIKQFFHINGLFFIGMINIWCILLAKFSLKEKNTISCMKDSNIPILFIHGLEDDFVPSSNSRINYEEYNGPKELELFPNANHGISYLVDPDRYIKVIKKFLNKYK